MKKRRSAFSAKTVAPIEPPQKKPAMDAQKSGKKKNKKKNKQETVSANVELYTGTSQTEIEPVIVGSENRDEEMDAMKAIFAKAAKQKVEKSRLAGKIEPESLQSDNNHESGDETFDSDVPSTSEEPSASPKKEQITKTTDDANSYLCVGLLKGFCSAIPVDDLAHGRRRLYAQLLGEETHLDSPK